MSTRRSASAVHNAASAPGSSFTVVRIRHSSLSTVMAEGGGAPPVSCAGGALPWRRAHHAWKAAVHRAASSAGFHRRRVAPPCKVFVTSDMSRFIQSL
ncbi:hypothetical protein GCM10010340_01040 [Streptomyces griseoloalbus]|nr:hypothetical protein GCM10010340_01040 [Streptomyces albaduncus]